jgi:hypothetical protein
MTEVSTVRGATSMTEGRRIPFSERIGAVRRALQKDSMDEALKNSLWNLVYGLFWSKNTTLYTNQTSQGQLLVNLWSNHFYKPTDELRSHLSDAMGQVKKLYFASDWASSYDFIEFITNNLSFGGTSIVQDFVAVCNAILVKHVSAYRFVGTTLTPITSEEEIESVEQAMSHGEHFRPVVTHIETALACLADRTSPDYRNSIKESISAVEAACQIITGDWKATLGKALKQLGLHPALEKGFCAIYGYTGDDDGIRHALSDEATVNADDAKFFLVACSAFVNYLIVKSSSTSEIPKR